MMIHDHIHDNAIIHLIRGCVPALSRCGKVSLGGKHIINSKGSMPIDRWIDEYSRIERLEK